MSYFIESDTMSELYPQLVKRCLAYGRRRSPRGQDTYEIPNVTFRLHDPSQSEPVGIGRRYGPAILAAEALSLVGGISDPDLMVSVGSNFKRFLDGGVLHGTYGPRVRMQVEHVIARLKDDPDTRQAILQIWDPLHDQASWTPKDLPCTLNIGFAIFDNMLECSVNMRSNDVWWGTAHDVPMFTCLQQTVAQAIGLEAGPYTHHAYSFHLYDRDLDEVEKLHDYDGTVHPPADGLWSPRDYEYAALTARQILTNQYNPTTASLTEQRYNDLLRPHARRVNESRLRLTDPIRPSLPA